MTDRRIILTITDMQTKRTATVQSVLGQFEGVQDAMNQTAQALSPLLEASGHVFEIRGRRAYHTGRACVKRYYFSTIDRAVSEAM